MADVVQRQQGQGQIGAHQHAAEFVAVPASCSSSALAELHRRVRVPAREFAVDQTPMVGAVSAPSASKPATARRVSSNSSAGCVGAVRAQRGPAHRFQATRQPLRGPARILQRASSASASRSASAGGWETTAAALIHS